MNKNKNIKSTGNENCHFERIVRRQLVIKPLELVEANKFVIEKHRHHGKVVQHRFSIGCYDNDCLCGVAICGRPLSRFYNKLEILEVRRLCTDGTKNACSKLYGACANIAKHLGYKKIITYILESETGTSLKASGWLCEQKKCGGKNWNGSKGINRSDTISNLFGDVKKYPNEYKKRYSKKFTV